MRKREKKLSVLARLSNFMTLNQRRTLMKTFIESQFGYCPLVCMFRGGIVNKKLTICMKGLYELFIKIKDLLKKDNSVTIHHRNIQSGVP